MIRRQENISYELYIPSMSLIIVVPKGTGAKCDGKVQKCKKKCEKQYIYGHNPRNCDGTIGHRPSGDRLRVLVTGNRAKLCQKVPG